MNYSEWLTVTYGGPAPVVPLSAPPKPQPVPQVSPASPRRPAPLTCAGCGARMNRQRSSLPQGEARCHPCRRLAPSPSAVKARRGLVQPVVTHCRRCDAPLPAPSRRYRYCTRACARKARNARGSGGVRWSASARGYGVEHQRLRLAGLEAAVGTPCVLCGEAMDDPVRMHLDHTDDRTGYRGFAHDRCNWADGARRGGQAFRARRLAGA